MGLSPAVTTLCENPEDVFLDVAKLLLTYADNILRNPNEVKYRSIRIGNPTFSTKLLPIKGAVECLFEMGFEEAETHLVFPQTASVEQLRLIRESIAAEREQRLCGGQASAQGGATASVSIISPVPSQPATPVQQPPSLSSMNFLVTLQSNFQHVMVYENPEIQRKARSSIPHEQLSSNAEKRMQEAKEADPGCKVGKEDFVVLELLRWFKQDFFSWVDALPCSRCGGRTQNTGALSPSTEDLRWGAQRVENHFCQTCQLSNRFPRYNNPEKLLETRRGRCGEWANCFTLCCRAMGLEARYVWDSTDHVWTEVYSPSQRRWLHCDSCENTCDKPLLYEVGWGKKLSYILAFSRDQVVDVTWRYSCKHPEVLSRRTKVQEAWLLHTINSLNSTKQHSLGPERKKELTDRLLVELVEFISPKKPNQENWVDVTRAHLLYICMITDKLLHIRYNASKDEYCRVSNNDEVTPGWDQCVWQKEAVFRKVESDWQMVYLARTEGSSAGRVSWKFDFSPVGMKIKSVTVTAHSQTFQSGTVCWKLQSGQTSADFSGDGEARPFPSLSGSAEFVIVAELCGGDGDAAWQHTQLFRQSLKDTDDASFEILVQLENA
uniref:Peptide-N(4)-(N-acetyl-beta-glucosaminyl)asparagine amidase n=1 Tax=Neogobius melanostomus TaxID=47308 RepID=A0A8C6TNH4_9GOBI